MAQQWRFVEDDKHQWHWQRTEDNTVKSAAAFSSATECMLDAVRYAVQRRRTEGEFPRSELLQ